MSQLAYAIHQIERIVEGQTKFYAAGEVHDFSDFGNEEGKRLIEIGAIREPSEDEVAVYNARNGGEAPAKSTRKGKQEPKLDEL